MIDRPETSEPRRPAEGDHHQQHSADCEQPRGDELAITLFRLRHVSPVRRERESGSRSPPGSARLRLHHLNHRRPLPRIEVLHERPGASGIASADPSGSSQARS